MPQIHVTGVGYWRVKISTLSILLHTYMYTQLYIVNVHWLLLQVSMVVCVPWNVSVVLYDSV